MSTSIVTSAAPAATEYPSSDGKPMAENDAQRLNMIYAGDALGQWFAKREDVYVSGDLPIYYEEDNPNESPGIPADSVSEVLRFASAHHPFVLTTISRGNAVDRPSDVPKLTNATLLYLLTSRNDY